MTNSHINNFVNAVVNKISALISSHDSSSSAHSTLFAGYVAKGDRSHISYGRVDSTSTSTAFTATVDGLTTLVDGTTVMLRNGYVTSAEGFTLNVNNLGAKPVYNSMADETRDTTIFNIAYTMLFVYDSTRVTGGCWVCYRGYNSDKDTNTIGYQIRTNSSVFTTTDRGYRYRIWLETDNGQYMPVNTSTSTNATANRNSAMNTRKFWLGGKIVYNSTKADYTTAGTTLPAATMWQQYNLTLGYSFNGTGSALTLTSGQPVYMVCTDEGNGQGKLASPYYTQTLPSTEDGKLYIYLGHATAATTMELALEHPIFEYRNGGICLWSNNTHTHTTSQITDFPTIPSSSSDLSDGSSLVKTSNTNGLIKNDGTIDTSSYLTTGVASATYVAKENGKGLFSGSYSDLTSKPSYTPTITSSTTDSYKIGSINISGSAVDIYGKDTNTEYTHPTYPNVAKSTSALYKIKTNSLGHIIEITEATSTDIANLGVEITDTVYTHPTYTSKTSGLYKITVDGTGHISGTASVSANDLPSHTHTSSQITGLTIPTKTSDLTNDGDGTNAFVKTNDSRLSDARTPTSHTHGNVQNDGKIKLDGTAQASKNVVTDSNGNITTEAKPTIPTKTSDLTNDSGFLTSHQDITGKLDIAQTSYKGKNVVVDATTGNITFENKPTIPSKTSDLTNDSGFLTSHQDISGKLDKSQTSYKGKNVVVDSSTGNITFEDKNNHSHNIFDLVLTSDNGDYSISQDSGWGADKLGYANGNIVYDDVNDKVFYDKNGEFDYDSGNEIATMNDLTSIDDTLEYISENATLSLPTTGDDAGYLVLTIN